MITKARKDLTKSNLLNLEKKQQEVLSGINESSESVLAYLADILVEEFITSRKYEHYKHQKGSDLLQSFNERTSR
jgi:hypothetical protein